jgi:hypothetical protein
MSSRYGRYLAALGGLTLLLLATPASSQQPSQRDQPQAQSAAARNYEGQPATTLEQQAQQRDYAASAQHPPDPPPVLSRAWWARLWGDPIAVFTVLLALIGGAQVAISHFTARHQLRAYVIALAGSLGPQRTQDGFKFEVNFPIKNFGQTPAYRLSHRAIMRFLPAELPASFDFSLADPVGSVVTLGPQQELNAPRYLEGLLSAPELAEFYGGSGRCLYVYGTVTYDTAFISMRKRKTEFCWRIAWQGTPDKGKPLWWHITRHQHAT